MGFSTLEQRFTKCLGPSRVAPVAVTFLAAPPAGIKQFAGEAPSGCSFWKFAAEAKVGSGAFFTVPSQHYNCPIGSYTHHIDLPKEREKELSDTLGLMASIGYVKMEEVPEIPRWKESPAAVLYSRLAEAPQAPDVVIFALKASAAMLLGEASRAAGKSSGMQALPRPTCMAIPAAAGHGTTLAMGCVGNRVYTGLEDGEMYAMVRGADLELVAEALEKIVDANQKLLAHHTQRKATLTRAAP